MRSSRDEIIVISGINLFEGGPLSIYYDCLDSIISLRLNQRYKIILFVHKKALFDKYEKYFSIIELPLSRKNYLFRLYYEYIYFYKFSLKNNVKIWISLHDITPRVKADRIYTYCHNPSPFMVKDIRKIKYDWQVVLFSYFYKYLYRINIKSSTAVIVQQAWLKEKFLETYPISNVIVATPNIDGKVSIENIRRTNDETIFIYASYPRYFKNFEIVLKACKLLEEHNITGFKVWLTINGTENKYAKSLKKKYGNVRNVRWMGVMQREKLFEKYEESDCLIFPSTLETWGLPISEYKQTNRPMLLADLPYAHETAGKYDKVMYFNPYKSEELCSHMISIIDGNTDAFEVNNIEVDIDANNWEELMGLIFEGN